jgi:hypothetical protein
MARANVVVIKLNVNGNNNRVLSNVLVIADNIVAMIVIGDEIILQSIFVKNKFIGAPNNTTAIDTKEMIIMILGQFIYSDPPILISISSAEREFIIFVINETIIKT